MVFLLVSSVSARLCLILRSKGASCPALVAVSGASRADCQGHDLGAISLSISARRQAALDLAGPLSGPSLFPDVEELMAEAIELKAWARQRSGKGGARATRRDGRIPGILYGDKHEPQTIAVDYRAITQQLHTGHFQSTI